MASLLNKPWIEDSVVSALLYHKQKATQDRSSQVAQVISVRRNTNVVVLSDTKSSIEAFYENLNGTLRHGALVRLKDWNILTSGTSGVCRDEEGICLRIGDLEVVGGHGMGLVGKPTPLEVYVGVATPSSSKSTQGDVAKLLQDPFSHYRILQQSTAHPEQQAVESPASRKRPFPENTTTEQPNSSTGTSPHVDLKKELLQGDKNPKATDDLNDSVEDGKEMSIADYDDDEQGAEKDTVRAPAMMRQNDTSQPAVGNEDKRKTNRFLKRWLKTTRQPDNLVETEQRAEGPLLKKWRTLLSRDNWNA